MRRLIKVQFKRRRKGKTDYLARRKMLSGDIPRVVIRKTSRYLITQLVKSKEAQDTIVCSANSKDLTQYGWPTKYSIKNLPASYLTGFLLGKRMQEKKIETAILDLGLARSTKGGKIYAALKGVIDAGISINCSKEILPSEGRIKGEHIKDMNDIFEKVKGAIQK